MPDLIIEGRRIGYGCNVDTIDVSKTVLLLIHGSGGDRGDWQWQLEGIKAPGGVIAIELPGHGESEGPGESSVPIYADWVGKFVLGLGLQRVALMGCSLGSAISQWICLERKPWVVGIRISRRRRPSSGFAFSARWTDKRTRPVIELFGRLLPVQVSHGFSQE